MILLRKYFAIYSNGSHLDWSVLLKFAITQCKNHFETILIKIHSAVIEILFFFFLFFFLFCFSFHVCAILVTADGGYLRMPHCKKSNRGQIGVQQGSL